MNTPKRDFKIHDMDSAEEIHSGSPLVSATHSVEVVEVPPHHLCEVTLRPREMLARR